MTPERIPEDLNERLSHARNKHTDLSVSTRVHKRLYIQARVGYMPEVNNIEDGMIIPSPAVAEAVVKIGGRIIHSVEEEAIATCLTRLGL